MPATESPLAPAATPYTPAVRSRLPAVGTTIFSVMSALATECGAVNLGQGFPDFDCDARLLDAVNDAMRAGHNQYSPMAGVPALRLDIPVFISTCVASCFSQIPTKKLNP